MSYMFKIFAPHTIAVHTEFCHMSNFVQKFYSIVKLPVSKTGSLIHKNSILADFQWVCGLVFLGINLFCQMSLKTS
jgi:hypothetical protein